MKNTLTALLLTPLAALHGADLLPLTPAAMTQLERAQKAGLIEIAPVHLPPPDAADCNHYGCWVMWSDGPGIEDQVGQRVKYATSPDGLKWSTPQFMTPVLPGSGPDSPRVGQSLA